jgi:hypothetical protein
VTGVGQRLAQCCRERPDGESACHGAAVTTLLFPIGHCLGAYYVGDGTDDHVQQVRLGREIVDLSDHEFDVWSLAHGFVEEFVEEFAAETAEAATPAVDRLLGRGLLAKVDVDSPAAADFARRHRLLPLHIGLGESTAVSNVYAAGTTERPLVAMSSTLYDIWLWGHLAPNLLVACEDQLTEVLTALPSLLAPNAACLDLVVPEYGP